MNVIKSILSSKQYKNLYAIKRIKTEVPERISKIADGLLTNNELLKERDEIISLLREITKDINYTFELGTLDLGALTSAEHNTISINNNRGSILNNNTVYTTLEHRVDPRVTSIGTSANSRWAAEETSITSRSNVSTNNSDRFDTFF